MNSQFVKALALIILSSAATYLILTTFNHTQTQHTQPVLSPSSESTSKPVEIPTDQVDTITESKATPIKTTQTENTQVSEEKSVAEQPVSNQEIKANETEPTKQAPENGNTLSQLKETDKSSVVEQANMDSTSTVESSENISATSKTEDNIQTEKITQNAFLNKSFSTSTLQQLSTLDKDVEAVKTFCRDLSNKLRTVKYKGCMQLGLAVEDNFKSVKQRSLTYRHFMPQNIDTSEFNPEKNETGRILFISGIHGDEYSAISITYLWMLNMLKHQDKTTQHWLFLPLTNPDGLYRKPATRINANNVDLNRNFPSPDWDELALDYWKNYYKSNKRRFPGNAANSQPETQWMVHLIEEFKPDAIISVHAPYGLVDYDGPEHATPGKIGALKHRELGTYPGSLGRYAGEYLKIPVLTLELRAAGSMPSNKEIYNMWRDVEEWTNTKVRGEIPGPIPNFKKAAE